MGLLTLAAGLVGGRGLADGRRGTAPPLHARKPGLRRGRCVGVARGNARPDDGDKSARPAAVDSKSVTA